MGYDVSSFEDNGVSFPGDVGVWYHVGITFKQSDGSYTIRVWDDTNNQLYTGSGNFANYATMNVSDAILGIGSRSDGSGYFDGLIDEMVVFKRILTTSEIDDIRNGVYSTVQTVTASISDSLGVSESIGRSARFSAGASESFGVLDSQVPAATLRVSLGDSTAILDSTSRSKQTYSLLADAFGISDQATRQKFVSALSADSLPIGDALGLTQFLLVSAVSQLTPSDASLGYLPSERVFASVSDALGMADGASLNIKLNVWANDTVQIIESVGTILKLLASVSSQFNLVDSVVDISSAGRFIVVTFTAGKVNFTFRVNADVQGDFKAKSNIFSFTSNPHNFSF